MPALNFTVFLDKILSGEKCQTIRPPRKHPIKPGDKLYLYTGMRHPGCRKLGEAVCSEVHQIEFVYHHKSDYLYQVSLKADGMGIDFPFHMAATIAIADGFNTLQDFFEFFITAYKIKPGESKIFDIINWRDFKKETPCP